jgi:2-dehydro-3-deoxyphosphogluconate aldolase/(4S)-4-hydroxy-2-oxoglutarate aldolase
MKREEARKHLLESRVIAVIRAPKVGLSRELADAYVDAGITAIELTTSIPDWETALREVSADLGDDALVGVGTVTSAIDALEAIDLGAEFIVSPFVSQDIIEAVNVRGVPVLPGALTPTEVAQAYEFGADMIKVFPASSAGGPAHIKALLAPMPNWDLIPTGGVTPENTIDYFRAGAVAVGLGSNLAPKEKVRERDWQAVTEYVKGFLNNLNRQLEEDKK